ncbi:MAG: hypothetical protein ACNA71_07075 [Kiritimatiellia bacterium]
MGKLLRVLVIFLLLASVAALVLAHILFERRELLRGRVETMHRGIVRFARTIESAPVEVPAIQPNFPERDLSPATPEPEPSPRRSQFWRNYQVELESVDQPLIDLTNRRRDLMTLYRIDASGVRITDGPGTMQGVLDDLITRAGEQYNTLTATRQQMKMVREELIAVIQEFNGLKNDLRTEKATVVRVEGEREEQRRAAETARRERDEARELARERELRIGDLEQEQLILIEEKETLLVQTQELTEEIASLNQRIVDLEQLLGGARQGMVLGGDDMIGSLRIDIPVGEKGTVISVDQDHLFVVIQLDDQFMEELLGAAVQGRLPMVELFVERGESEQRTFITKVRITQVKRDRNLAIGDILLDWQQMDIQVGDRVFYQ